MIFIVPLLLAINSLYSSDTITLQLSNPPVATSTSPYADPKDPFRNLKEAAAQLAGQLEMGKKNTHLNVVFSPQISLQDLAIINPILSKILSTHALAQLQLDLSQLQPDLAAPILKAALIESRPNNTIIDLICVAQKELFSKDIINIFKNNAHMLHLSLKKPAANPASSEISTLITSINPLFLQTLVLIDIPMSNELALALGKLISGNTIGQTELQNLYLYDTNTTAPQLKMVLEPITSNIKNSLRSLIIDQDILQEKTASLITQVLMHPYSKIEGLYLKQLASIDEAITIIKSLAKNTHLTSLILDGPLGDDRQMETVFNTLLETKNRHLNTIKLYEEYENDTLEEKVADMARNNRVRNKKLSLDTFMVK